MCLIVQNKLYFTIVYGKSPDAVGAERIDWTVGSGSAHWEKRRSGKSQTVFPDLNIMYVQSQSRGSSATWRYLPKL